MGSNNSNLSDARKAKNDEFYTQYSDIEAEMNAYYEYDHDVFKGKTVLCPCDDPENSNFTKYFASNFDRFGLKKLICTSYAKSSGNKQLSLFEEMSPFYIPAKHENNGRLYILERDADNNGDIDIDDIEFKGYLKGDGDFRSNEVCKLRGEADIIVTNPPFSLFREFLAWIMEGNKQFAIIANVNAITYKEVFPLLKENKMWLGYSIHSGDRAFYVPADYPLNAAGCGIDENGRRYIRVKGVRWFTNLDHGQRHEPLKLDTMAHNLKFNKKLRKKLVSNFGEDESNLYYPKYENYDAIEVPITECIPSDYDGLMGLPITFMDKYDPNQFNIVGCADANIVPDEWKGMSKEFVDKYYEQGNTGSYKEGNRLACLIDASGIVHVPFKRILIQAKHPEKGNNLC